MSPIINEGTPDALAVNPSGCSLQPCAGPCPSTLTASVNHPNTDGCGFETQFTLNQDPENPCAWWGSTEVFLEPTNVMVELWYEYVDGFWELSLGIAMYGALCGFGGGDYVNTTPIPGSACPPIGGFAMTLTGGGTMLIPPIFIS